MQRAVSCIRTCVVNLFVVRHTWPLGIDSSRYIDKVFKYAISERLGRSRDDVNIYILRTACMLKWLNNVNAI